MGKVAFFFDGFNLYHALDSKTFYHKYKWLDLRSLAEKFVTKQDNIEHVLYFTALATWDQNKVKNHKLYIKALESKGVEIIYGEFRRRTHLCRECKKRYETFEEKRTDVNISISLFIHAILDSYDKAVIVTGDSDMIPAIEAIKKIYPSKTIIVAIPIRRRAELLKQTCHGHIKIKEKHLKASLFPEELSVDGKKIECPTAWRYKGKI